MTLRLTGRVPSRPEGLELLFPFDPRVAATTLLPSAWDAQGYEGHLTYSFAFLQTVLLREPAFRARLLRPLH